MTKFRKRPIVVEARCLTLGSQAAIYSWLGTSHRKTFWDSGEIDIITPEGTMRAHLGDWIIQGIEGEFYPCRPDIFEATYERVEE